MLRIFKIRKIRILNLWSTLHRFYFFENCHSNWLIFRGAMQENISFLNTVSIAGLYTIDCVHMIHVGHNG